MPETYGYVRSRRPVLSVLSTSDPENLIIDWRRS